MSGAPRSGIRGRRILVTGGTGFLGGHLVRRLVRLGGRVHVLARRSASLDRIADVARTVTIVHGDLRVRADVRAAVARARADLVFHLAAHGVDPRRRDPITIVRTNVVGLVHLLEALRETPYTRLVNTGTCFECARQSEPIAESTPLDPVNVYAASKTMALHVCATEGRLFGKSIVTVRPFTFYGPGEQPGRLIPSVIRAVLANEPIRITTGTQTRDYTYVEDTADAFVRAALTPVASGEVVHVGTGHAFPVRLIAQQVRDILGSAVPIDAGAVATRGDDHTSLCADATKAKRLLGWQPRVSFEAGVRKTAAWMRRGRGFSSTR